jgi:hypothetical protein
VPGLVRLRVECIKVVRNVYHTLESRDSHENIRKHMLISQMIQTAVVANEEIPHGILRSTLSGMRI